MAQVRARTLEDDGERMIPELHHDGLIYAEHLVRYIFASGLVRGKRVLDLGCGVGYGTNMLKSAGATEVVGIDRSIEAITYGRERHADFQPDYLLADAESQPLRDRQFDVVVSFETIEHLVDYRHMLAEAKRVMCPGGLLILSTPNKGVYMEGNPFHTKEFTFTELEEDLTTRFEHVGIFPQDNWITSAILSPSTMERADKPLGGNAKIFKAVGRPTGETLYLVALCSDAPLPKVSQQVAMTDISEVQRYVREIGRLSEDVHSLSRNIAERDTALAERDVAAAQRDALLTEKDAAIADKDAALADKDAALVNTNAALVNAEAALAERESLLAHREQSLDQVALELTAIRRSRGFRVLEGYRRLIRWLFPPGSWRGLPYRALRRAVGMLLELRRNPTSVIRRALKARRNYGTKALIGKSINHLAGRRPDLFDPLTYALSVDWRTQRSPQVIVRQPLNIDRPTVNWVIPTVGEGGGHLTIFRFTEFMQQRGYRQRIYEMPVGRPMRSSREELTALIQRLYGLYIPDVHLDFEDMEPADITIATSWHTAYPVVKFAETRKKLYFVLDFDPLFTARGTESVLAENTYRFGLHGITGGRWLAEKLTRDFGMECDYFNLAVDHQTYFSKNLAERKKIFFYARPVTPRRGFELGLKALEIFHSRNPGYQLVFAGGDLSRESIPFPVTKAGYLSARDLNDLYNESAAALVISLTNCSLLPSEIMATGCPVVTTTGENNEKVLPAESAIFAAPSPYHLAEALENVVRNPPPREKLIEKGSQLRWEDELAKVEAIFKRLLRNASGR